MTNNIFVMFFHYKISESVLQYIKIEKKTPEKTNKQIYKKYM